MQTLQLQMKTARKIFNTASKEIKEILMESFGSGFFTGKLIDRVTCFEDLIGEASEEVQKAFSTSIMGVRTSDEIANAKIKLASSVAWDSVGKKPDWNDSNQYKWWPRFIMAPVFRFLGSRYDCEYSFAGAGSRLSFPEEEMSDFFGKLLIDIYKDLQN